MWGKIHGQEFIIHSFAYTVSILVGACRCKIYWKKDHCTNDLFDFVVGVSIGSVTANLAIGPDRSILPISIIILAFAVLAVLTDVLHLKSNMSRKIMDSKLEILIRNGELIEDSLKKTRIL